MMLILPLWPKPKGENDPSLSVFLEVDAEMNEFLSSLHTLLNEPPVWAYVVLALFTFPFYLLPPMFGTYRDEFRGLKSKKLLSLGIGWLGAIALVVTAWLGLSVESYKQMAVALVGMASLNGLALGVSFGAIDESCDRGPAMFGIGLMMGVMAALCSTAVTVIASDVSEASFSVNWESQVQGETSGDFLVYDAELRVLPDGNTAVQLFKDSRKELSFYVIPTAENAPLLSALISRNSKAEKRSQLIRVEWEKDQLREMPDGSRQVWTSRISKVFPD